MLKKLICFMLTVSIFMGACSSYHTPLETTNGLEEIDSAMGKDEETENIKMVNFVKPPHVSSWVSEFNGHHPDAKIEMIVGEGTEEDLWNSTMAELAAGKGPDIFCMRSGDERIGTLYEKGILAELDEYVPLEVKNQIFPGIIKTGCVEQEWVGLGVEGTPLIFITSDALWDKDSWNLENVISIAQKNPDLEGLFVNLDFTYAVKSEPLGNAELLFENPYIFIGGNNKSQFESKLFLESLEILKKYKVRDFSKSELPDLLKEGKILGVYTRLYLPGDFVNTMNEYCHDGCHFVSMVGQEGYVGKWSGVYLILINKNTKHVEEIRQFLEGILDYDKQNGLDMTMPVREDVIRGKVSWREWSGKWEYNVGDKTFVPFMDPEGKSYLEEYISFLKNLGQSKDRNDVVYETVMEEVGDYLQTTKSALDTAKTLNNRMELYLTENQ